VGDRNFSSVDSGTYEKSKLERKTGEGVLGKETVLVKKTGRKEWAGQIHKVCKDGKNR